MNSARRIRIVLLMSIICGAVCLRAFAQQVPAKVPTPTKPASTTSSTDTTSSLNTKMQKLPLRRVVLYKSGVGYFEHDGRVRGNEDIDIDLTSSQLDDVLKSLTALDLSGGRITGASYNSQDSASRQLDSLPVSVGEAKTLKDLLVEMRGARLEVHTTAGAFTGRLLSVEEVQRSENNVSVKRDQVSLLGDSGEMRSFMLDASASLRFADRDLEQQLARALGLLDSTHQEDTRHLVLSTTGNGERQIRVSYISEVPVWKTTYRIVLPSAANPSSAKPLLQGWAVVDNTVGEDWNDIELSLAAGAPQSFIQHISQPYYTERPEVPMPSGVLLSPQTHGETLTTDGQPSYGRLPPAPPPTGGRAGGGFGGAAVVRGSGGGIGSFQAGVGSAYGGSPGSAGSSDALLVGGNSDAGGKLFAADDTEFNILNAAKNINVARGNKLGDLFQYTLKDHVSIRKNESALVPIIQTDIAAEKVALWNAGLGMSRPLRALWMTNPSSLVLDGGSFSIVEGGSFAGEGLLDPIQPGEKRLISYAADLAMQVVAKPEGTPQKITNVRITRGVLVRIVESRQRVEYTVRNEDTAARTLILEHPVLPGWTLSLSTTATPEEESATAYRFRIEVPSKETKTFTVEASRADTTQFALTNLNPSTLEVFIKGSTLTPEMEQAMRRILAQKDAIAKLDADLKAKESAITDIVQDQDRLRENMKSLKGTPEEKSLAQRYTGELNDQETQLAELRKEHAALQASRKQAQQELDSTIENLNIGAAAK
jgi:hypothetical protein